MAQKRINLTKMTGVHLKEFLKLKIASFRRDLQISAFQASGSKCSLREWALRFTGRLR